LHIAAYYNQPNCIDFLLSSAAVVAWKKASNKTDIPVPNDFTLSSIDGSHFTVYHYAIANNSIFCLQKIISLDNQGLINKGNENGISPLIYAVKLKNEEIIKILLSSHQINVNATDSTYHWTALYYAISQNFFPSISLLLSAKANVNALTRTYQQTPLMLASHLKNPEIVKCLLDARSDITAKDICGEQALHHASKQGTFEVIQLLLSHTKITNEESGLGFNPLDCTLHKLLYPLAEHRINENSTSADINENYLKSYLFFCKQAPTERTIAKTEEVVRVAEKLTDLAARTVKIKDKRRMGKRSFRYHEDSDEESHSSADVGSDTDEFKDTTNVFTFNFTPIVNYHLPKFGEIDVDMGDFPKEKEKKKEKEKEKPKKAKKKDSSDDSGKKKENNHNKGKDETRLLFLQ